MSSGDLPLSDNVSRVLEFRASISEMIDWATEDKDFVLAAKLQECLDHLNKIKFVNYN